MHMPGLFVTFEGGEGSGKSTQLSLLAERLRAAGSDPLVVREPGGTPLAEGIRALLLDPSHAPGAVTEALLMVAARADLVATLLKPALDSGRVVLCDRYGDSTLAYQGGGRGLDPAFIAELERNVVGISPGLTLLLDLGVHQGRERMRVRERYLELARAEPARFVVLDATLEPGALAAGVWSAVSERLHATRPYA